MNNNEIQADYALYEKGLGYNRRLTPDYYKTIDVNEAFFCGDHWRNVKSNGQPTLIMPVYKRIADHEIASILSSPIKGKFSIENFDSESEDPQDVEKQKKVDMLNYKLEDKWEKDKLDILLRECLTDGFNTGDYAIYTYWDKNKKTKQYNGLNPDGTPTEIVGDFCNEVKDGSEIMFGNPNNRNVQSQPYILIMGRGMVSDLREEAKSNGVNKVDCLKISGDSDFNEQSGDRGKIELDSSKVENGGKCLYIIKLWKKNGEVFYRKSTKYCTIIKEQSMDLKRYPLAWGNWTKRKNSYHGQAPGTSIVPNQVAINQMYSNVVYYMRMTAFGKVAYDATRISGWDNRIGAAIPVQGDVSSVIHQLQPGQMNNNMFGFMGDIITTTKDLNGANDAALGDVNPEQASGTAIVALTQQSAIPLENPKQNLYQFIEELILNWQDFIESKYTVPRKVAYKERETFKVGEISGQDYMDIPLSLKIDVGPSKQWSEGVSVNTIMGLLKDKQITLLQALERMPNGYIDDKQGLIAEIKQQMAMQQQDKTPQYEQMGQFFNTLSPDVQAQLKALPDNQFEQAVMQLMKGNGNQ